MTLTDALVSLQAFLLSLGTAALRSIVLAFIAALVLCLFRIKNPSARLFVWSTVLCGALAIPFLGRALPIVSMPIPWALYAGRNTPARRVLPPTREASSQEKFIRHDLQDEELRRNTSASTVLVPVDNSIKRRDASPVLSLRGLAILLYFTVALTLLVRFGIGLALTHRLMSRALEIRDSHVRSKLLARTRDITVPRVCESDAVSVPVTVGLIRTMIVLPPTWRNWDDEKLDAVVAHEISHVTRHDALIQCAALFHRAVFWFSPLAWWLKRHIVELAEQASDEAALSAGADRNNYARTLLGFFETLHATPQRVWWQGVSMAQTGQAERRLEKILKWRGASSMDLKKTAVTVIIALAIPVICLTAVVHPTAASSPIHASQQPAPPAPASAVPPEPAAPNIIAPAPTPGVPGVGPIGGVPGVGPIGGVPGVGPIGDVPGVGPTGGVPAPAAPVASIGAVPPMPARPAIPVKKHGHSYWYSYGSDDEQRFVIVTGNSDSFTMSGSSEDARHVEKLRKEIPGDFIWFQRDEKSYIIRDQSTIDRARKLWAPQEELGKKQEELGKQQEELGKRQEELGAKMERVQVKVPDMTEKLDKLREEMRSLNSGATQEQIGKLQSEIGELQSQLGEVQSHAGEEQGKLGEQMGALGEQQGKLGEKQGELGRQQGELAEKATKEMKNLLDEAIKNGTAKPESETGGASL